MKTSENRDNPYRAPDVILDPEPGFVVPRSGYFWVELGMWLQLLTVIVGLGVASWKVDSIVGTGPVLSILGILLAIFSYRKSVLTGLLPGLSGPAFSVVVFLIIFFRNWSPHDAQYPVPIMITGYLVVVLLAVLLMLTQIRNRQQSTSPSQPDSSNVPDSISEFRS